MRRKSEVQKAKLKVQKVVLEIVRILDGGCVFRKYPGIAGRCGGITHPDHIIGRTINSTFAYLPNIACTCAGHHLKWKVSYPTIWSDLLKEIIGQERWDDIHKKRHKTLQAGVAHWNKVEAELKEYLEYLQNNESKYRGSRIKKNLGHPVRRAPNGEWVYMEADN